MNEHKVAEIQNQLYYIVDTSIYTTYIPTGVGLKMKNNVLSKEALVDWKIMKPSIALLHQFVVDAAYVADTMGSEMEGFIVTNTKAKNKKPFLMYPKQQVGPATCIYERNIPGEFSLLVDLHSHHTMSCGFSQTDNSDDGALSFIPRISIVVLDMDKNNLLGGFKTEVRLSYRSQYWKVDVREVFAFEHSEGLNDVLVKYIPPVVKYPVRAAGCVLPRVGMQKGLTIDDGKIDDLMDDPVLDFFPRY